MPLYFERSYSVPHDHDQMYTRISVSIEVYKLGPDFKFVSIIRITS